MGNENYGNFAALGIGLVEKSALCISIHALLGSIYPLA
jgi:hypothetical protein